MKVILFGATGWWGRESCASWSAMMAPFPLLLRPASRRIAIIPHAGGCGGKSENLYKSLILRVFFIYDEWVIHNAAFSF